jgi:hypothetical protein
MKFVFWKPVMDQLLVTIESCGHELGGFEPKPPHILPNWKDFVTSVACVQCKRSLLIRWFIDERFSDAGQRRISALGPLLDGECPAKSKSLRQPAA